MKTLFITLLIISEVADPSGNWQARFVEIYNPGPDTIDLAQETWYLCKQSNGGSTWGDILLSGTIPPGECHVVAYSATAYFSAYGFAPDQSSGNINGNGDDGYFLFSGGDHNTGTLIDAYGVIDQDGTGEPWEYLDTKATRKFDKLSAAITWDPMDWTINQVADTFLMTPSAHRDTIYWTGSHDNDWHNNSNWNSPGNQLFIPDASYVVIIPANLTNYPTIGNEAYAHDMLLNATSSGYATLTGVEYLGLNGQAFVECFLTGGAIGRDDPNAVYHFAGTPVDSIAAIDVFPGTAYLREWNEVDQEWINLTANDTMITGRGYSTWLPEGDTTLTYTGKFIAMEINPVLTYTSGGTVNPDYDGYNLVSNPFPSGLDWDLGSWVKVNLDATIAIWDGDAGNYLYWNGTVGGVSDGIIPPCQGFFVRANNNSPQLTIPVDACVHGNEVFYTPDQFVDNILLVKASGGEFGFTDETYIGFIEAATQSFDKQFDAIKLFGLENAPQLYSLSMDDHNMALNMLPPDLSVDVPLHFSNGYSGEFSLLFQGMDNFNAGTEIILLDLKLGTQINILEFPEYHFTYHPADASGRFMLVFSGIMGESEYASKGISVVSATENQIILEASEKEGKVILYNLLGQDQGTYPLKSSRTIIPVIGGRAYIVRIITGYKNTVYRIFVP